MRVVYTVQYSCTPHELGAEHVPSIFSGTIPCNLRLFGKFWVNWAPYQNLPIYVGNVITVLGYGLSLGYDLNSLHLVFGRLGHYCMLSMLYPNIG